MQCQWENLNLTEVQKHTGVITSTHVTEVIVYIIILFYSTLTEQLTI